MNSGKKTLMMIESKQKKCGRLHSVVVLFPSDYVCMKKPSKRKCLFGTFFFFFIFTETRQYENACSLHRQLYLLLAFYTQRNISVSAVQYNHHDKLRNLLLISC